MRVGRYEALIRNQREQIVAIGSGRLARGSFAVIIAESAQTEIEGWVSSAQPLPSPLRLKFATGSNPWIARVAPDGSFRVTLGDLAERSRLTIWAEAGAPDGSGQTLALTHFLLKETTITRGLSRLDLADVQLPPVVVHVDMPPVAGARYDEFAELMLNNERGAGFKLLRGLRTQFLAGYGVHTITVRTNDLQRVLSTVSIDLTPAETERRVVLNIQRQ